MFEDHQVMYDDAHVHFTLLSGPGCGGERRAQLPLVPTEGALDLPALAVGLMEEVSLHLTAILGFRPTRALGQLGTGERKRRPRADEARPRSRT